MKNISDKDTFEKREEKKLFIETYGCQMNVADSEVVASIMQMAGYTLCDTIEDSDAIFVNTCSIRDNAEQKVLSRLSYFQSLRKHKKSLVIGVLGCMAERVREQLITENGVDLVVGPDSYLDLPNLVGAAERGEKAVNVELSTTETYREVIPSRIGHNRISGFISIMRGCNNFCSYCIVPYTRGRERSREPESILGELADLKIKGFKEVTLLGQNVNSYRYERPDGTVVDFPALLALVAQSAEGMRVRFTTSHPKDMSDETLRIIAAYPNVCRHIHLPVQSGSSRLLKLMNRNYTKEHYLELVDKIRSKMPDVSLTTDIIVGFPGETDEQFEELCKFVKEMKFDKMGCFKFSPEEGTPAYDMPNQVEEDVKSRREEVLGDIQYTVTENANKSRIGKIYKTIVDSEEGDNYIGRSYLDSPEIDSGIIFTSPRELEAGDFVNVKITDYDGYDLIGELAQ